MAHVRARSPPVQIAAGVGVCSKCFVMVAHFLNKAPRWPGSPPRRKQACARRERRKLLALVPGGGCSGAFNSQEQHVDFGRTMGQIGWTALSEEGLVNADEWEQVRPFFLLLRECLRPLARHPARCQWSR